jgi:hypothetical protein
MSSANQADEQPSQRSRIRDKWGVVTDPGFLALPYVLLLHQFALGLSSEHLNVLLHVLAHWHSEGRMPYPHTNTIAKRMGASQRTVQRSLSWLSKNGFLAKVPKRRRADRQAFDPDPLVKKLTPYALERVKLIQQKDYAHVLSDDYLQALSKHRLVSAEEMFRGVAASVRSIADEL